MSILQKYKKQPIDRLDYDFDYSLWLAADDEIISVATKIENLNSTASETPVVIDSTVMLPRFIKIWLSGGAAGDFFKVSCTITTSRNRVKQDEIKIKVIEY